MAYTPKDWSLGNAITDTDLDHIENGIANVDSRVTALEASTSSLDWHLVGGGAGGGTVDPDFPDTLFQNGWDNYNLITHSKAAYSIDGQNIVRLQGAIGYGTVGSSTPVFVLPTEYRPPRQRGFAVQTAGTYGNVIVKTDGSVCVTAGSNAYVYLDGINFTIDDI